MITTAYLTNKAYGFPSRGALRRIKPPVLAVVHITGNSSNQGPTAATNERNYANRANSGGPSAHYYINRDGSGVHAIDEAKYAAWSNGDVDHPNTTNAGVAKLLALRTKGYNANEGCYLEIECVGYATAAGQWTDAQFKTVAGLIAKAAKATGLPINRSTVLTHADINSINRPNCAFLAARREASLSKLIALAKAGTDVVAAAVTDEHPKQITSKAGSKWYDVDGTTVVHTQGADDLDWRASPYGVGTKRAMYATVDAKRRIVLVTPTKIGTNTVAIRDVPPPVAVPDPTQLAAARTEGFTDAKTRAANHAATAATAISTMVE